MDEPRQDADDRVARVFRVASYAFSVFTVIVVVFAPLAIGFAFAAHVRGDPSGRAAIRAAIAATLAGLAIGLLARGLLDTDEIGAASPGDELSYVRVG